MSIPRRTFLAASAAGCAGPGILRFAAGAAEFSYRWSHSFPQAHVATARIQEACNKTLQESNGRFEIRQYPNNILGGGDQQIEEARLGALELSGASFDFLQHTVPVCGITAIPFAFSSYQACWNAVDGPFGKAIRDAIAKSNLYIFDRVWEAGLRQLTNSVRPIRVPTDLQGLKIRTNAAAMETSTFKAFGAIPTVVDGPQIYTSLQTHIVDGTDLGFPAIVGYKLYEIQKYVSIVNHSWSGYCMVANPAAWQRLPADLRTIAERNINAAGLLERSDVVKAEATTRTDLESKGMTVNDADSSAFKAIVRSAGLYPQWRTQFGASIFDLLEKAVGKLG